VFEHSRVMQHLPPEFANNLAQVLEPSDRGAAATIIEAANALARRMACARFWSCRVNGARESAAPVAHEELNSFLAASKRSRRARGL